LNAPEVLTEDRIQAGHAVEPDWRDPLSLRGFLTFGWGLDWRFEIVSAAVYSHEPSTGSTTHF